MSYAFLDISIGRAPSNRVIIELFDKIAPETCHFFKSLLSSSPGYKSTLFTRIIEDFMIQGGDVPEEASLNCPSEMENPTYAVDKPGLVGMARTSAAEKNAQFFITLVEAQHLNGQHTIFGKVVKGMEVVNRIGGVEVDDEDKPVEGCKVLIVGCGELQQREKVEEKPVSPERKKKLVEEDRERSVSPRRDDETRRKRSRSSREDKYEQRRRSSSRDGERRHRHHHHHHRHHRRSKYGDSELDKNDADRDTERSECHTKHDDRDADSSRRDSTPTGPRAYQERRQYRPESNYGRLGYDTGYDGWRDDEDRLREIERQREEERGREEPQIIFKGRGAMKYREPRSFGSSRY
jgi:cyclophilin family peptidyl-prolyl cis-trans isomerase